VCQQLRELRIQFLFGASEQDLQQLVFERLSTLVRLRQLRLDYVMSDRTDDFDLLECRLEHGLGRLASLQQLTSVCLGTPSLCWRNPNLGMEDVVWMVENWKTLEIIRGSLNKDKTLTAQLQRVFESHGIAVKQQ
jgi:hypothetical protein